MKLCVLFIFFITISLWYRLAVIIPLTYFNLCNYINVSHVWKDNNNYIRCIQYFLYFVDICMSCCFVPILKQNKKKTTEIAFALPFAFDTRTTQYAGKLGNYSINSNNMTLEYHNGEPIFACLLVLCLREDSRCCKTLCSQIQKGKKKMTFHTGLECFSIFFFLSLMTPQFISDTTIIGVEVM